MAVKFCKRLHILQKSKFQPLANGTCFIIEYAINLLSKGSFSFKGCLNFRLLALTKTNKQKSSNMFWESIMCQILCCVLSQKSPIVRTNCSLFSHYIFPLLVWSRDNLGKRRLRKDTALIQVKYECLS